MYEKVVIGFKKLLILDDYYFISIGEQKLYNGDKMDSCIIKSFKILIICLALVFICGCKSCRSQNPIEYYNELKMQFGENCMIRNAFLINEFFVKDEEGKVWIITLSYKSAEEGPDIYIYKKELIFI